MSAKTTYVAAVNCSNCGNREVIAITLGRKIVDEPCPKCGCKTLGHA